MSELIAPLPAHRFDTAVLYAYLAQHIEGFAGPARLRQFQGGQSNPTFLIETPGKNFVLRKKPPGTLLPSAHQIGREYRIQQALASTPVPVAAMLHYATDASIIGTEFYIMDYLEGRVFGDVLMPGLAPDERGQLQARLFEVLAALHSVDFAALGLADYGQPVNYLARQISRWKRQYEASAQAELPEMTRLIAWLEAHIPAEEATAIVHGDFRLGNMMIDPAAPRITAVLDWELSTLGHPLADLAYCCMAYHLPPGAGPGYSGYAGLDLAAQGLRGEAEMLELYCRHTGRAGIEAWPFYLGFSLFRGAAIAEGVYARALAGNAADARAARFHEMTELTARTGWAIVQG